MSALRQLDITGTLEDMLYCRDSSESIVSESFKGTRLVLGGIAGDCHGGLTRSACSRFKAVYEQGAEIRNSRQLTVVSTEELAAIAGDLDLDDLPAAWLGANLVISGIPHLTLLPPSTRLRFDSGAVIVVDLENRPCVFPAKIIESHYPGKGKQFVGKAMQRRGFTAWVERPGDVSIGDTVTIFVPSQVPYPV